MACILSALHDSIVIGDVEKCHCLRWDILAVWAVREINFLIPLFKAFLAYGVYDSISFIQSAATFAFILVFQWFGLTSTVRKFKDHIALISNLILLLPKGFVSEPIFKRLCVATLIHSPTPQRENEFFLLLSLHWPFPSRAEILAKP